MTVDVFDFMNSTPDETPEVFELPNGTYRFVIRAYRVEKVGQDSKDKITFSVVPTAVVEGELDATTLEYAANVGLEFWGTPKSLKYNSPVISARAFLRDVLGLPTDIPYSELFELAIGREFTAATRIKLEGQNKDMRRARVHRFLTD